MVAVTLKDAMMQLELKNLAELALLAAQEGAQILLSHLGASEEDLVVRAKRDGSLVSAADIASHRAILKHLQRTDIPVISEEGDLPTVRERQNWPWFWLVDPLDGTESFLNHRSGFAVNIALCNADGPVVGVVADPLGNRAFVGVHEWGAEEVQLDDLGVRKVLAPGEAKRPFRMVLSRNESAPIADLLPPGIREEDVVAEPVSGALKFCLLATGEAEIHSRTGPYMEWDCAAGDAVLRSIGLTTFDRRTGERLRYNSTTLRVEGLWVSRID
jgi:3'(2'), 5'-bisphosphate nucleotidase